MFVNLRVVDESISIHALLAESDNNPQVTMRTWQKTISIHALLAESDVKIHTSGIVVPPISIHALLAESDMSSCTIGRLFVISIHALLAESDVGLIFLIYHYFYPRSPCGERHRN